MSETLQSLEATLRADGRLMWTVAVGIAITLSFAVKAGAHLAKIRLEKISVKTRGIWDDVVVACLGGLKTPVLFLWFLFPVVRLFETSQGALDILSGIAMIATLVQVGIWCMKGLEVWRGEIVRRRTGTDASSLAAVGLVHTALRVFIVVVLFLIGLSNLGVDIGALIAGLGIGGIAVALAAQNVLGDLLASLSIVLDKPFVVGDAINVGGDVGIVENIGIKTTRLRALSGEEMVFSNKDLLESRVRNYKRMHERRVVQSFGVMYSTSVEKLRAIPGWIKDLVDADQGTRFDRCHLIRYGASSLDFELVFYVNSPAYNVFVDLQQKLLLGILEKLRQEGVSIALPTQTLIVSGAEGEAFARSTDSGARPL